MKYKIKFYRTKKKLSRKELADKVGISQEAIRYYELGRREPKASILKK